MKVIITGATGFVGRHLAERFHSLGFEVTATGRSNDVGEALQSLGIKFKKAEILNRQQIIEVFGHADCLIHCAGKSGPWGKYRDFFTNNVIGTRNVIEACRLHRVKKIIFISTPSLYYNGKDRFDVRESDPLPARQTSAYSKSKLISELDLTGLQDEGFSTIIFRPRALFGPYDNTIVPRILRMADNQKVKLIDQGRALVDLTCIENFIDAVLSAIKAPSRAWNQIYNISNGNPISVKDFFSLVLETFNRPFNTKSIPEPIAKTAATLMEFISYLPMVNKEPPMTRFTVGYLSKSMTLNIGNARRLLNYTPKVNNQEGFENYRKWAQQQNCY